jgi:fatty-acid desaturase
MFALTFAAAVTAAPWYAFAHGYHIAAWAAFTVFLGANGMAITCGYHRLFAHGTYEAHPALKLAYLLCGAMTLRNSALIWSVNHRTHHRFIDDPERDLYCLRAPWILVLAHRLDAAQLSEWPVRSEQRARFAALLARHGRHQLSIQPS